MAYGRKRDLYQSVTDKIVAMLEKGVRPWERSWGGPNDGHDRPFRPLRHNGEPYRGINVLGLWAEAMIKGYGNPYWMTYNQALAVGGQVRKGETGSPIVFYTPHTVNAGSDDEKKVAVLRSFTVFNVSQIDNLPAKYFPEIAPAQRKSRLERLPEAEAFFESLGQNVSHSGSKAFYMPSLDRIQMPPFEAFHSADAYYSTRGHESVHWTSHETRLNRVFAGGRWAEHGYAMEELVAELGAAFLCADLGLASEPRADHADYLAIWLKVLKADKKAIFTAAGHAEKAVRFMHAIAQPTDTTTADGTETEE